MALTVVRGQARRRWLVVGAVALALVAAPGVVAAIPVHAGAVPVADLVARIRASAGQAFEGYAVSTGTAGLPSLPQLSEVSDLLDGDTSMRVWYASPHHWRVDVIGNGTERDTYQLPSAQVTVNTETGPATFVLQDRELTWDYGRSLLTEVGGTAPVRLPRGADLVPSDLGRRLLAAAEGERYSALPAKRVAGIAAAGVRIVPANPHTTVGHVDIWADPRTGLPVEVSVTGKGATDPILVTRFLDLRLGTPPAAVLAPPEPREGIGYTVTDADDLLQSLSGQAEGIGLPFTLAGFPLTSLDRNVATYGTGLTRFVLIQIPRTIALDTMNRIRRGGGIPQRFPDGDGVLVATPLLTVLASDAHPVRRNYLLAGLVDSSVLKQAGAELSQWGSVR